VPIYEGIKSKIIADTIISFGNSFPSGNRILINKHSQDGELLDVFETSFEGNPSTFHIDNEGNFYLGLFGDFKVIKFNQLGVKQWEFEVLTNLPSNVRIGSTDSFPPAWITLIPYSSKS